MNKISLSGFAADNAPKWVATKSKNAWGQASIIAERKALGATLQELANEYAVSMPTISRIIDTYNNGNRRNVRLTKAVTMRDTIIKSQIKKLGEMHRTIEDLQKDLAWAKQDAAAAEQKSAAELSLSSAAYRAEIEELRNKLTGSRENERAAIERLTSDDTWAKRWENEYLQAKADLEAAEAQISHMAERLAECRGRGFWARVFNR